MDTEQISIKFLVEATTWADNQSLDLEFYLDDQLLGKKTITGLTDVLFENVDVPELDDCTLSMHVSGMKPAYTQVSESGEILQDVLCVVHNVELDEIALDILVYEKGKFVPKYPVGHSGPELVEQATHLGHNGVWSISFSNPLYLWLLENM
jgi:hypothetical protein